MVGCVTMILRIKHFFITLFAGLLRGLGSARSYVAGFFRIILHPFVWIAEILFKFVVLPFSRLLLVLQRAISRILLPARNGVLSFSAHRYIVHALVVIIVMAVSVFNVRSYTAHSETFGDESVFTKLIHGDTLVDDSVVEEIVDLDSPSVPHVASASEGALSATVGIATSSIIGENAESITATPDPKALTPTVISVPSSPSRLKIETYIVQDGDTLWDISKKFGIDVPTLLATNDFGTRGIIHLGDQVKILPVSGILHTVKKGETVGAIAKKYAIDTTDIFKANMITAASIVNPGEELIIPGGTVQDVPVVKPVTKPKQVATAAPAPTTTAAPVQKIFAATEKPAPSAATGEWVWPTSGHSVTQPFKGKAHTGIDVDGVIGSPEYAAHDGVVEFAGWSVGYGLSIVINHGNGLWTRYGHTSQIYVKIGDTVTKGQTIALMGTSGKSTGSHLHFEVLSGPGKFLNPLKYVK
jgi:murein DD-endopeptidase MepM/ murein hydrolase activator NlpD